MMDLTKFDMVIVRQPDGTEQQMENRVFAALPLTERVKLVASGQARFLKDGAAIPAVEALKAPQIH